MTEMDTSSSPSDEWKLRCTLDGHGSDVKCIASTTDGRTIVTGSRDNHVRVWTKDSSSKYDSPADRDVLQCDSFVNSVALYPASGTPKWILAGTNTGHIFVFDYAERTLTFKLKAHVSNVCCMKIVGELLITGSWDCTAKLWKMSELGAETKATTVLKGHEGSVWSVALVEGAANQILTGSADKTVKLWIDGKCDKTFSGVKYDHELRGVSDCVRAIASLSPTRFASVGNDGTLSVWNMGTGERVQQLQSVSGNFLYCIHTYTSSSTEERVLVTGSEGGFVELWTLDNAEDCTIRPLQLIRLPCESVWSIDSINADNDVMTACSDGRTYIFTQSTERYAPAAALESFDAALAVKVNNDMKPKDNEKSITIKVDVADDGNQLDLVYNFGEDPYAAAERFVQSNHLPVHHLNTVAEFIVANVPAARQKVPSTVPEKTAKQKHNGKEYDYVWDVETGEGNTMKLPYNVGETPTEAAQRFIMANELPHEFLEKITNFIKEQTPAQAPLGDPLTGGGRYIPGASTGSSNNAGYSDPLTGSGRYVPGQSTAAASSFSGDPFTGSGGYKPGAAFGSELVSNSNQPKDAARPRGEHTPLKDYVRFGRTAAATTKAIETLRQNNERQTEEERKLNAAEIDAMCGLMTADGEITEIHLKALEKSLTWQMEDLVPAMDVFRIALLNGTVQRHFFDPKTDVCSVTLDRIQRLLISDASMPLRVLICRALANACTHPIARGPLSEQMSTLMTLIIPPLQSATQCKPIVQVAAASCLANFALVLLQRRIADNTVELGPKEDCVRTFVTLMSKCDSFADLQPHVLLLLLQAFVTILWGDRESIAMARSLDAQTLIGRMKDATKADEAKFVARDIQVQLFDA